MNEKQAVEAARALSVANPGKPVYVIRLSNRGYDFSFGQTLRKRNHKVTGQILSGKLKVKR